MPVRESERELSNIEFLKVLRDIEVFLVKKQNEKPKNIQMLKWQIRFMLQMLIRKN